MRENGITAATLMASTKRLYDHICSGTVCAVCTPVTCKGIMRHQRPLHALHLSHPVLPGGVWCLCFTQDERLLQILS